MFNNFMTGMLGGWSGSAQEQFVPPASPVFAQKNAMRPKSSAKKPRIDPTQQRRAAPPPAVPLFRATSNMSSTSSLPATPMQYSAQSKGKRLRVDIATPTADSYAPSSSTSYHHPQANVRVVRSPFDRMAFLNNKQSQKHANKENLRTVANAKKFSSNQISRKMGNRSSRQFFTHKSTKLEGGRFKHSNQTRAKARKPVMITRPAVPVFRSNSFVNTEPMPTTHADVNTPMQDEDHEMGAVASPPQPQTPTRKKKRTNISTSPMLTRSAVKSARKPDKFKTPKQRGKFSVSADTPFSPTRVTRSTTKKAAAAKKSAKKSTKKSARKKSTKKSATKKKRSAEEEAAVLEARNKFKEARKREAEARAAKRAAKRKEEMRAEAASKAKSRQTQESWQQRATWRVKRETRGLGYGELLGLYCSKARVSSHAEPNILRRALRRAMAGYHPDKMLNKTPEEQAYGAEVFRVLKEAHEEVASMC